MLPWSMVAALATVAAGGLAGLGNLAWHPPMAPPPPHAYKAVTYVGLSVDGDGKVCFRLGLLAPARP